MPEFDNTQAENEGWSIFACDGSANGDFQLQKCDETAILATDMDAWVLVRDRAAAGSPYHIMAMLFLETRNPVEWQVIKDWKGERI